MSEGFTFEVFVKAILDGGRIGCPVQLKEAPTSAELNEAEALILEGRSLVVVIYVDDDNVATAIQV